MKRKLTIAAATIAMAALPHAALADGPYGAIVYSDTHQNSYFVTDMSTQAAADAAALEDCHKDDPADKTCWVALSFHDACGSFADSDNGAWGTGWGTTEAIADQWAIDTCVKYGGTNCKPQVTVCSPEGPATIHSN